MTNTSNAELSREQKLSFYRQMLLIRRTEEQLVKLYAAGKVFGACHTYIGEEAVAVGVCAHLRREDTVFSTHRGHGHALAKGVAPHELIAELLGRATGCSGGRGGSMHLFKPEVGFMGSSGIVGPSITLAAGSGYTARLLKTGHVAVAFFGDGAVNNGSFHEGINLAANWGLPVVFVCENNLYATEIAFAQATRNPSVASRADAYGLPGVAVDGNDVLAVFQAAGEAVRRARAGEGPTLVECRTYRIRPHSEGMRDAGYRTAEEVAAWKARCPIQRFEARLLDDGFSRAELEQIDAEIKAVIEEAVRFAESSPWPDPATVADHLYSSTGNPISSSQSAVGPTIVRAQAESRGADAEVRELSFVEAAREGLAEEMARDPSVFVVGQGIGPRGGNFNTTVGLFERFGPERLRDTPICERGFTALCIGAAATGSRPVVDFMFIDFLTDAFGDLFNQAAKLQWMSGGRLKMPLVLRGCIGVLNPNAAHHCGSYYPFFAHIPGFVVAVPATPRDAKGLLKTAIRCDDPVLFLEHKNVLTVRGPVPDREYLIPFGQAAVAREGRDVTIVAIAFMVHEALRAADELAGEGISAEVIDPRTVAPLDIETILASVHRTGRLLVVDEDYAPCGMAAEIAAQVMERAFDDLDAPVQRLNGIHTPAPYSPAFIGVVPNAATIAQAVRDLMAE